jgi:hypothetical protein
MSASAAQSMGEPPHQRQTSPSFRSKEVCYTVKSPQGKVGNARKPNLTVMRVLRILRGSILMTYCALQ